MQTVERKVSSNPFKPDPEGDEIAAQLRDHLNTGVDWEPLYTPIPGTTVVKVPASKNHPARLLVEVNPVGKGTSSRNRRGLFLADVKTLENFLQVLSHPDLGTLLQAVATMNSPAESPRDKPMSNTSLLHSASSGNQVPRLVKTKILPVRGTPTPETPVALPNFDLAVSERGALPIRASKILRISDRAVLVANGSGREIWVPKMALCGDSAPPAAPQATPWSFSVKGWFVKKRDFQEWLLDGS